MFSCGRPSACNFIRKVMASDFLCLRSKSFYELGLAAEEVTPAPPPAPVVRLTRDAV